MIQFEEMYGRYLDTSAIRRKRLDVPYGPDAANRLDVYYPSEGDGPWPCIVFFHGGGFFKGDKGRYQLKAALQGVERGYAVASVNYRMLPEHPLPAAYEDAAEAVGYLLGHASDLGLASCGIVLWGESSGASLAVATGLALPVAAIVDWYAPLNASHVSGALLDEVGIDAGSLAEYLYGGLTGTELTQACRQYDLLALTGRARHIPPTIIQHGTADELVPPEDSMALYDALASRLPEALCHLDLVEGAHHGVADFDGPCNVAHVFAFIDGALSAVG